MRSLSEHASALGDALFAIHQSDQLSDIYSYLQLASSVAAVKFKTPAGSAVAMCASMELPSELTACLAASWSRFAAVWFALQAYDEYWSQGNIQPPVEFESPPAHHLQSTSMAADHGLEEPPRDAESIQRLCYKLSRAYNYPLPDGYDECLKTFEDPDNDSPRRTARSRPAHVLRSAEGLYLVNNIRHSLVKWNLLDADEEESWLLQHDPAHHPSVMQIETATRLLLITMQMMTLCIFPRGTLLETCCFGGGFREREVIGIDEAMLNLHLDDFETRVDNAVSEEA